MLIDFSQQASQGNRHRGPMKETEMEFYRRLSLDRRQDVLSACEILLTDVTAGEVEIAALLQVRALLMTIEFGQGADHRPRAASSARPH